MKNMIDYYGIFQFCNNYVKTVVTVQYKFDCNAGVFKSNFF